MAGRFSDGECNVRHEADFVDLQSRWRHWRSRFLETCAKQCSFASYAIDLLLVMI